MATVMRHTVQMRGPRIRLVLIAVALVAVAGCGPAFLPAATAPPEPADAVAWPDITWAEALVPPLGGPVTEHLAAVAANDDGYVAVGFAEIIGRRDGVILSSPDGRTWERVGVPEALRNVDIVGVAAGPGGFVAVGSASAEDGASLATVAFRSADGRAWVRGGLPGAVGTYVYSIGGGPGGYVVAGNDVEGGPATWFSADGSSWQRVPTEALGAGSAGVNHPVPDGDGWIALGSNVQAPALLRSADGLRWTTTSIEATTDAHAYKVVAGRWGYLVSGGQGSCGPFSSCPSESVTWWSGDGAAWTRLTSGDGPLASGGSVLVAAGDRGFVGMDGASAWSSTTGWSWTPMPEPGDGSSGVNAVVVRGDAIVAVGDLYRPDGTSVGRIVVASPVD